MTTNQAPHTNGILRTLWRQNHYFFWVWLVLTLIVVVGYETQFDRERICAYQYCPSTVVVAASTTCLVAGIVWVNIFFSLIRPILQILIGRWLKTRIVEERANRGLIETLISNNSEGLWSADESASFLKKCAVVIFDFFSIIFLLVIPMAAIIALGSGIAYLEQQHAPPPPGLALQSGKN